MNTIDPKITAEEAWAFIDQLITRNTEFKLNPIQKIIFIEVWKKNLLTMT